MTGIGVKSTFAGGSTSLHPRLSQPAPSKNNPWTYTPSDGGDETSSLFIFKTSFCRITVSRDHDFEGSFDVPLCARVTSYRREK